MYLFPKIVVSLVNRELYGNSHTYNHKTLGTDLKEQDILVELGNNGRASKHVRLHSGGIQTVWVLNKTSLFGDENEKINDDDNSVKMAPEDEVEI